MRLLTVFLFSLCSLAAGTGHDLVYAVRGQNPLHLDFETPAGDGPFPTVVIVHGGGWQRGDKQSYVPPLFQPLIDAGFAWFSIDYRLAPEAQFPAPADDVQVAVRWVKSHAAIYHLDTKRLVLAGESAGGQLVGYVGSRYGTQLGLAAVIDFYGPNDMLAQAESGAKKLPDPTRMPDDIAKYLGVTAWNDAARAKLREASPITYASAAIPFLFIHGTADQTVPFEQSPRMCEAIQKGGGKCEVISVEGGGHGMGSWKEEKQLVWKKQMVEWLRKTVP